MNVARNLGYVEIADERLVRPADLDEIPPHEQLVLCTGSQGEPLSALTRIAYNDHPSVQRRARRHRDHLGPAGARQRAARSRRDQPADPERRRGAARGERAVHVSGHARAEELRTLLGLIRPKAVMPIHGEFRMLAAHGRLAQESGVPASSIVIAENGDVVELSPDGVRIAGEDRSGRDVRRRARRGGHLRRRAARPAPHVRGRRPDRRRDGVERAGRAARADRPRVRRVGRAARRDAPGGARDRARAAREDISEIKLLQEHLHDGIGQLVYDRTRRRPMILPGGGRGMSVDARRRSPSGPR